MIYAWGCDRTRFADFVANGSAPSPRELASFSLEMAHGLRGERLLLLGRTRDFAGNEPPRVVVTPEAQNHDFIAWSASYLRYLRPITAHFRVLAPSSVELLLESEPVAPNTYARAADLGLIFGESALYVAGRSDPARLNFAAVSRTMSYLYAQLVRRYPLVATESGMLEAIAKGWRTLRAVPSAGNHQALAEPVTAVWKALLSMGDPRVASPSIIVDSLREITETGQLRAGMFIRLCGALSEAGRILEMLEGPREQRVAAVARALPQLAAGTGTGQTERAFALGYLASRIQPGTLEHFPVLNDALPQLKESLLWYGLFAGISPETAVGGFSSGLGWLVRRELNRRPDWLDAPTADIALTEFLMLSRDGSPPAIRSIQANLIQVEVMPLLSSGVRWPEASDDSSSKQAVSYQSNLFSDRAISQGQISAILDKIDESAKLLAGIRKDIAGPSSEGTPNRKTRRRGSHS